MLGLAGGGGVAGPELGVLTHWLLLGLSMRPNEMVPVTAQKGGVSQMLEGVLEFPLNKSKLSVCRGLRMWPS